ncbi:MAG: hypothetical protein LQ347_003446, partial [Umbilicaria vellea]
MERPRSPTILMNDMVTNRCSSAMRPQSVPPGVSARCASPGRPSEPPSQPDVASGGMSGSTAIPVDMHGARYMERGQRWMEKQETRSVSRALRDMDLQDGDRLHGAAQTEASELVCKHRDSGQPYRNSGSLHHYKEHLRKGSHARSQSLDFEGGFSISDNSHTQGQRSVSDSSASANSVSEKAKTGRANETSVDDGLPGAERLEPSDQSRQWSGELPQEKTYTGLTFTMSLSNSSSKRRTSGSQSRNASAEKRRTLFRNPDDQIYEEPEEMTESDSNIDWNAALVPPPLTLKPRNSITKPAMTIEPPGQSATAPLKAANPLSQHDIHKNPPSQSRNPSYVKNAFPPTPPDSASVSDNDEVTNHPGVKSGIEIRGNDIRAATSMRLKDRSPKLPTPTVCGELLECVAFYPEPDHFRSGRVARIRARAGGEEMAPTHDTHIEDSHPSEEEDGDESLRFYCHLDFHELFSPRCRSCKTPIEGEVVVACGGEWHVGHFFCAECGDPFDAQTPFVEKEGYA